MSDQYAGQSGRMLPSVDILSKQTPGRLANRLDPGDNPYQLPPPRAPANYTTDQFIRPRQMREPSDPRIISTGMSSPAANPPRNEQLPSVRDLLIPAVIPTSPATYQPPFGPSTPNAEPRELSYPFRPHEQAIIPVASQDRIKPRSESFPQQQHGTLPPLSHVAMHSPPHVKHHISTRSDPTSTPYSPQAQYNGGPIYEKAASAGDASSPELAAVVKANSVLPHVIDERFVNGEGVCYVYADGTHVPKLIDGVPVNANWGVTKAGKPRKRLAQACLTCREKKIKCQPNLPKCDQCQKSGRECRFESA